MTQPRKKSPNSIVRTRLSWLAFVGYSAMSYDRKVTVVMKNGTVRKGRVLRVTRDKSLLPADPRRRELASNVVFHMDDSDEPVEVNRIQRWE